MTCTGQKARVGSMGAFVEDTRLKGWRVNWQWVQGKLYWGPWVVPESWYPSFRSMTMMSKEVRGVVSLGTIAYNWDEFFHAQ